MSPTKPPVTDDAMWRGYSILPFHSDHYDDKGWPPPAGWSSLSTTDIMFNFIVGKETYAYIINIFNGNSYPPNKSSRWRKMWVASTRCSLRWSIRGKTAATSSLKEGEKMHKVNKLAGTSIEEQKLKIYLKRSMKYILPVSISISEQWAYAVAAHGRCGI
jgi:hypothetical protein